MDMQTLIAVKRDGERHTKEQLQWLAQAAAQGTVPDYQLAAWLMAAFLHPLDAEETAWLTLAMADSGERIDRTGLPKPWIDKHSTGGVGDKTTLVLLPLLAACGLTVVKMSGRGLGVTGGTVDKLESVPGFRMDLTPDQMKEQAARIGLAISGQTPNLAPADKTLYALRDATGTVSNIPLIVSSILSKKLAGGAEVVVLDVKCGSGAFMTNEADARELGEWLVETARLAGVKARAIITDMNQPLGHAVGNALEVAEAIAVLKGAPGRFTDLCVHLASETLVTCGLSASHGEARETVEKALAGGAAFEKAAEWFAAQGSNRSFIDDPSRLPQAPVRRSVPHIGETGWVSRVDAEGVGRAVIALGGGRQKKEDRIDPSVGVVLAVEVGSSVAPGDPLFTVHAASEADAEAAERAVLASLGFSPEKVETPRQILGSL